jgi:caffeoyl-CoA O-methyltransferase
MPNIVQPGIDEYAEAHTTPPPDFMQKLADETRSQLDLPQMLTGAVEGRFLEMLAHATQAKLALDIGTYSGYSSLSMAAGMPPGGRVITCEANPEHAAFARRHIEASPYADMIEIREGPALETLATLDGPFDLVFIDADKTGYPDYFHAVVDKLSGHGLIALDNMLRAGTVLDDSDESDGAVTIRKLNEDLARDERGVAVLLSVRDGITLFRRAQ